MSEGKEGGKEMVSSSSSVAAVLSPHPLNLSRLTAETDLVSQQSRLTAVAYSGSILQCSIFHLQKCLKGCF